MKKKLFIGISAPNSVDLLIGQLSFMKTKGYDVYLLAPDHQRVTDYCNKEGVNHIKVEIERNISPLKDLLTLIALIRIFWKHRPDIINLGTPKMSLVGMIAGFITRVPYRIYTCRGFRFEHESGSLKKLLIRLERVTSYCAHKVYCISQSVRDLGVELDIFPLNKTRLIGKGSSNGVDLDMFNRKKLDSMILTNVKKQYQLDGKFVFGFVGRIVDRKGIKAMYDAFNELYDKNADIRLLVVGRPFWDQIKDKATIDKLNSHPGIVMAGFQKIEMVPYFLALMDVFLLPALWEGFGNVLIQAAAMGVPIVATDVTGCKDAVSKNFNGILVPLFDHDKLVHHMAEMIQDKDLREELGANGKIWSESFRPQIIWEGYHKLYNEPV